MCVCVCVCETAKAVCFYLNAISCDGVKVCVVYAFVCVRTNTCRERTGCSDWG